MKKEFITPVLEMMGFSTSEDIMVGLLFTSADRSGASKPFVRLTDTEPEHDINADFRVWKGKD